MYSLLYDHTSQSNSVHGRRPRHSGFDQHQPISVRGIGRGAGRLYPPQHSLNSAGHTATEQYQLSDYRNHWNVATHVPESNGSVDNTDVWPWRWQCHDGNNYSSSMSCVRDDDWRRFETTPQTHVQPSSATAFNHRGRCINGPLYGGYGGHGPVTERFNGELYGGHGSQCGPITERSGKQHRRYRHSPYQRHHTQRQH